MVEPMVHDYYNELPTTVRIINEMNEELDNVMGEKDNTITELKKIKYEHNKFIDTVFQYFRDEPDNEILKGILEKPLYRDNPFIFKCSDCECIADERDILYSELPHYVSYFSGNNTENKVCFECFSDGYTEFYNELISEHFNIECNHTVYVNGYTGTSDLGSLLILHGIATSESKDKYNDLNKLFEGYFELTSDWERYDEPCRCKYPDNHEEELEEEEFITNFKKILKEICPKPALISDSRDSNYYKLLYSIIPHDLDPTDSNHTIFNKLIGYWKKDTK